MSTLRAALLSLALGFAANAAQAERFSVGNVDMGVEGYVDLRAVLPSDQTSWIDGGLGKLRYGDASQDPEFHLGEIIGQWHAVVDGAWTALVVARIENEQRTFLDVTEAYVRYRPVSLSPWRWSVKAGAFFPPVSLENTEIGWASPWTLTPSAINTWVGEELRTIGGEAHVEWRSDARTLSVTGGVYGWNDPTGILLAGRGWSLNDRVTALIDKPRIPDVYAKGRRLTIPSYTYEFLESDGRAGWYAGASWDETGIGHFEVLRYDNEADPTAIRIQVAWETKFWSAGARTEIGPVTLLAQAMTGSTYIKPSASFFSDTNFDAAYLLAGWDLGEWRFAGRFDVFSTDEMHTGTSVRLSEHGNAVTFAANWIPNDWSRLTLEWLHVNSTRAQRTLIPVAAAQSEDQLQLSYKFYLN